MRFPERVRVFVNPISLPNGIRLLYEEGLLPPNPRRAALAEASPSQIDRLASQSLALQTTATLLVIADPSLDSSNLSSEALETLVSAMAESISPSLPPDPAVTPSPENSALSPTAEPSAPSLASSAAPASSPTPSGSVNVLA